MTVDTTGAVLGALLTLSLNANAHTNCKYMSLFLFPKGLRKVRQLAGGKAETFTQKNIHIRAKTGLIIGLEEKEPPLVLNLGTASYAPSHCP